LLQRPVSRRFFAFSQRLARVVAPRNPESCLAARFENPLDAHGRVASAVEVFRLR
jgi:hypothetical protein